MNIPPEVVSRQEWLVARKALLAEEKAFTRAGDAMNTKRRELPMVLVDEEYLFDGPHGRVSLRQMFEGRSQLIIQHFMFDPEWDDGCSSCTAAADEISEGLMSHLHARDTTLAVVSRAPLSQIENYKDRRGWSFPWYSSFGSDFNYDYHVTLDSRIAPVEFNYRSMPELAELGMGWLGEGSSEQPGYSVFLNSDGDVFHTYSTFARGTEILGGSYGFLDMTALGRQEEWELPKGRVGSPRGAVPDFSD